MIATKLFGGFTFSFEAHTRFDRAVIDGETVPNFEDLIWRILFTQLWQELRPNTSSVDRITIVRSFSFDNSVQEVFLHDQQYALGYIKCLTEKLGICCLCDR